MTEEEKSSCMTTSVLSCVIIAILMFFVLSLSGCKTVKVVPQIHTEYVHDTIRQVDSIYRSHYIISKGDTIWQKDTIYEYRWRDNIVEVLKTDSVPYPVEVEKQVRYIPGFYKWSTLVCWLLIAAFIIYVACRIAKAIYLRR